MRLSLGRCSRSAMAALGDGYHLVAAGVVIRPQFGVERGKAIFDVEFFNRGEHLGRQRGGDDGGEVFGKLSAIFGQHFAGLAGVVMGLLTTNVLASFPP